MALWKGRPRRKPSILGSKGCSILAEGKAAPVLSPKPPTCSHSAVVASAAKGQLSLGSLNPKRRSVERVGAARTARAGKEAGLQRHVKAA